jgi:hypothetical protein
MHKLRVLHEWEEAVGTLQRLIKAANGTIVKLSGNMYVLVDFPNDLALQLTKLLGGKVSILKKEQGYAIRAVGVKRVAAVTHPYAPTHPKEV